MIVSAGEDGQFVLQKNDGGLSNGPAPRGSSALLSAETVDILHRAGDGSLGTAGVDRSCRTVHANNNVNSVRLAPATLATQHVRQADGTQPQVDSNKHRGDNAFERKESVAGAQSECDDVSGPKGVWKGEVYETVGDEIDKGDRVEIKKSQVDVEGVKQVEKIEKIEENVSEAEKTPKGLGDSFVHDVSGTIEAGMSRDDSGISSPGGLPNVTITDSSGSICTPQSSQSEDEAEEFYDAISSTPSPFMNKAFNIGVTDSESEQTDTVYTEDTVVVANSSEVDDTPRVDDGENGSNDVAVSSDFKEEIVRNDKSNGESKHGKEEDDESEDGKEEVGVSKNEGEEEDDESKEDGRKEFNESKEYKKEVDVTRDYEKEEINKSKDDEKEDVNESRVNEKEEVTESNDDKEKVMESRDDEKKEVNESRDDKEKVMESRDDEKKEVNESRDDKEEVNESIDEKEEVNESENKEEVIESRDEKEEVNVSEDKEKVIESRDDEKKEVNESRDGKEEVNESRDEKEEVNVSRDDEMKEVNESRDEKEEVNVSKDKEKVNESRDEKEEVNESRDDAKEYVNESRDEKEEVNVCRDDETKEVNESRDDEKEHVNESRDDEKEHVNESRDDEKEHVNESRDDEKEHVNESRDDEKEHVNESRDEKEYVNESRDEKEEVNESRDDETKEVNESRDDEKEHVNESRDEKEEVNEFMGAESCKEKLDSISSSMANDDESDCKKGYAVVVSVSENYVNITSSGGVDTSESERDENVMDDNIGDPVDVEEGPLKDLELDAKEIKSEDDFSTISKTDTEKLSIDHGQKEVTLSGEPCKRVTESDVEQIKTETKEAKGLDEGEPNIADSLKPQPQDSVITDNMNKNEENKMSNDVEEKRSEIQAELSESSVKSRNVESDEHRSITKEDIAEGGETQQQQENISASSNADADLKGDANSGIDAREKTVTIEKERVSSATSEDVEYNFDDIDEVLDDEDALKPVDNNPEVTMEDTSNEAIGGKDYISASSSSDPGKTEKEEDLETHLESLSGQMSKDGNERQSHHRKSKKFGKFFKNIFK